MAKALIVYALEGDAQTARDYGGEVGKKSSAS